MDFYVRRHRNMSANDRHFSFQSLNFYLFFFFIILIRTLRTIINRTGNRGHLWLASGSMQMLANYGLWVWHLFLYDSQTKNYFFFLQFWRVKKFYWVQSHLSFIYILSMAVFMLYQHVWIVVMEIILSTKPKICYLALCRKSLRTPG